MSIRCAYYIFLKVGLWIVSRERERQGQKMEDMIEFDSSSPIDMNADSKWAGELDISEDCLVRQILDCCWRLTCSFCLDPSSDRMVAKGINFSRTQLEYTWKGDEIPRDSPLSPRSGTRNHLLFSAQAMHRLHNVFYLLFHIVQPSKETHVRVITLPVRFEDLHISHVGKTPSPRLDRQHSVTTDDMGGCKVSFTYNVRMYTPNELCNEDIILYIKDVKLEFSNINNIKDLTLSSGEKVTMRVHGREYAGRANSIETRGQSRNYVWLSDPKRIVYPSDAQKKEEVQDLVEIGPQRRKKKKKKGSGRGRTKKKGSKKEESAANGDRVTMVSPRRGDTSRISIARVAYVPDNDESGNEEHMDTFFMIKEDGDDPLTLEFFNFRDYPATRKVVELPHSEVSEVYFREEMSKTRTGFKKVLKKINLGPAFGRKRSPRSVKKLEFAIDVGVTVTLLCNASDRGDFDVSGVSLQLEDYKSFFANEN